MRKRLLECRVRCLDMLYWGAAKGVLAWSKNHQGGVPNRSDSQLQSDSGGKGISTTSGY